MLAAVRLRAENKSLLLFLSAPPMPSTALPISWAYAPARWSVLRWLSSFVLELISFYQ
jgi:hypothetical protein